MEQPVEKQRKALKIRIKLGNIGANSASAGLNGRQNRISVLSDDVLSKAKRHRKLLEGYPEPSSSAISIVAALRSGWSDLQMLPSWDEALVVPSSLASFAAQWRNKQPARQPKRSRSASACCDPDEGDAGRVQQSDVKVPLPQKIAQLPCPATISGENDSLDVKRLAPQAKAAIASADSGSKIGPDQDLKTKTQPVSQPHCEDRKAVADMDQARMQPPGSSTSDQATLTAYHPSSSPEQGDPMEVPVASVRPPLWSSRASCSHGDKQQAMPAQQPMVLQKPSMGCQAGASAILPTSCLDPLGCSAAAASMGSISPFDLHMPHSSHGPSEQLDETTIHSRVQATIEKARSRKYAADNERGGTTAPWTVRALCKYVESAAMFMEACEYILKSSKSQERAARLAGLYNSTAALLLYTSKVCETAIGPDLSKDALRILAERLCAVCHMREAANSQSRLMEASSKSQQLSSKYSQLSASASAAAAAAPKGVPGRQTGDGAGDGLRGQPSPDGSTNSSHEVVMGSSRAAQHAPAQSVPLPNGESMLKLLDLAKQIARFSDLIRRSTIGFQAFIERQDYRSCQDAKLASMHIAAVSMDFGMVDGPRLLAHANKALLHILAISR